MDMIGTVARASLSIPVVSMYLMFWRCIINDIGHQNRQQLGQSIDATSETPIWCGTSRRSAILASDMFPMPDNGVNQIENAELVSTWCLLEMGEELPNNRTFALNIGDA